MAKLNRGGDQRIEKTCKEVNDQVHDPAVLMGLLLYLYNGTEK